MSIASVRSPSPPLAGTAHRLFLRLGTSNPFYVISAGLFLAGLYASFSGTAGDDEAWALMSGLAGYTLLLAVTAIVLVRFTGAWDDLRTVLLLVVVMFLATSVTFDEVLVVEPERGAVYYLAGLVFAVCISEAVLHGIRLRLPGLFRLPYYLILGLFFLYPLGLARLEPPVGMAAIQGVPLDETLMWTLFGFSPVAGIVFLTLLPAIRKGAAHVAGNGSPWVWPLYPWALFATLALAVPARSFLLCFSMHLMDGPDHNHMIFGPYFIVPFGLCIALLVLEIGIVARNRWVERVALTLPFALVVLTAVGDRADPVYQQFLETFARRLGGTPLFWTLSAAVVFFAYAAARRVPLALGYGTAALLALTFVSPDTRGWFDFASPRLVPLMTAGMLQLTLGVARRSAWNSAVGAIGLALAMAVALPADPDNGGWRGASVFHLVVFAVLLIGTLFEDRAGRFLRTAGVFVMFFAGVAVTLAATRLASHQLHWWMLLYPPAVALVLAVYGGLLRHRAALILAGFGLGVWLIATGGRGYLTLRETVDGLDRMALGLAVFVLAVFVSLGKSGTLTRWFHYVSDSLARRFDYTLHRQRLPGN